MIITSVFICIHACKKSNLLSTINDYQPNQREDEGIDNTITPQDSRWAASLLSRENDRSGIPFAVSCKVIK